MRELLAFYSGSPEYALLLLVTVYLIGFIYYGLINPKRCAKHGTNLVLASRFIGCEACFADHIKACAEESRRREEERLRHKARIFAEEFAKRNLR